MALIASNTQTLVDWAKKQDPNGSPARIVEILNATNEAIQDIPFKEANNTTSHRTTMRSGLPTPVWRLFNQGVQPTKSTTVQVDDVIGMLEDYAEVDKALADLNGNSSEYRLSEAVAHIEGLNQAFMTAFFYGNNSINPEQYNGMSTRYSTVNASVPISQNVIDGGGTGSDNTSIWFVTWGDHATTLLYPKGMKAGVTIEDKGEQRVLDDAGNPYYAKETLFNWHMGVAVKDHRYNARIANIDVSEAMAGNVDIWALLRQAYYRLESRRRDAVSSRIAIYMNRDMIEILDAQSSDRSLTTARSNTTHVSQATIEGKEVMTYRGLPIRETDALLNTEALVPVYA